MPRNQKPRPGRRAAKEARERRQVRQFLLTVARRAATAQRALQLPRECQIKTHDMVNTPFRIGFLLFPNVTQLDLTGPYEVLSRITRAEMVLVWETREPVRADSGLAILPTATFAECPQLDLICVPGGGGVNPLLTDADTLDFVRRQAAAARYVTAVCTGALVLGAAGLLKGRRTVTHWMSMDFLKAFGAIPVDERGIKKSPVGRFVVALENPDVSQSGMSNVKIRH
jgi:putative intracellular protease/amidase